MQLLPNKAGSKLQRPKEKGASISRQLQPSQALGCFLGPEMLGDFLPLPLLPGACWQHREEK